MPNTTIANEHPALVDSFAQLSADIVEAPTNADTKRLRLITASALRAQLRANPSVESLSAVPNRLHQVVTENVRANLIEDLDALEESSDLPREALLIVRRDKRDLAIAGSLVDHLTGLVPGERLGPFSTHGGVDVWFNIFQAADRMEIRETGASMPAIVITRAKPPVISPASSTIEIEPGTVWIRGDLLVSGLPIGAFIGIKAIAGGLQLNGSATITDGVVEIPAPLDSTLQLELAGDEVTPVTGACSLSDTKVKLPKSVTFKLNSGSSTVNGTSGEAEAFGQSFTFEPSTGTWTFVEKLWTLVLGYNVNPQQFNAQAIGSDLVHLQGLTDVLMAGLGLPVVVAPNPAILGESAQSAGWFLQLKSLEARWYRPDPRLHILEKVWVGISNFGATVVAENVTPLAPALTHGYDLWNIAGGTDKRLPWRQTYRKPFLLFYRCHSVEGEHLLVQGQTDLTLDRPVTSNGAPLATPATDGTMLLHKLGSSVKATLMATIEEESTTNQFVLRNALVWTSAPTFIFIQGELLSFQQVDAGSAQLRLGVYGWAPTLPDPYVSNGFIHYPRDQRGAPQSQLTGIISWTAPENVVISFEGQLGANLALGARPVSQGEPRPAPQRSNDPHVGLTQVEQDRYTFDPQGRSAELWRQAQAREKENRGQRSGAAQQGNQKSLVMIDGYLQEVMGPAPNLLLLDVSTNQDLLGVAVGGRSMEGDTNGANEFPVSDLAVHSRVANMRVVTLPQVQWEPVRTLDADQDIMTMGWFPTPLASATDGGATQIGARYQKLMPIIPEDALQGTLNAYKDGTPVGIRTTFPFGLVAAIQLQPKDTPPRLADLYELTRPRFPDEQSVGGIQISAHAEGGREDNGGISPTFNGRMRQLLNGVDLSSGIPLGISVLGETLQPAGSVETIFNDDMAARARVPVTRIDLSGYGGSNFSDWNNPFAAFAEAAKVQFRFMIGRTALEVIKINSVWHPWGVRLTRSVTIERRPGGGVIRRDSGWQAFTPGIFDYRYFDPAVPNPTVSDILVAPYKFDAGVFRGLFNVRNIRPAPGTVFAHGVTKLVPYYADADIALEGVPGRSAASGILGYLQTAPSGEPAPASAIQALIEAQGPIGGPIDTWMNFGGSGLPFRAQRVEVGLAIEGTNPLFVATLRGAPRLPQTGAWSVAVRPVASVPIDGGEAVTVAENRGVPLIRRYPVEYPSGDDTVFSEPPLTGPAGDYRLADAADLLTPASPANDYALLQSTPTHAFLFPRPFVPSASGPRIFSGFKPALADVLARTTSKGAFPPPANTIEVGSGLHFDVFPSGSLALSAPVTITGHPTPLRLGGSSGHGSVLFYDDATLNLEINPNSWSAEFAGLRVWADIGGMERLSGSQMRITGSTNQRSQITEIRSLILEELEQMLNFMPFVGDRGVQGPIELGGTNAKHELKLKHGFKVTIPPKSVIKTYPPGTGVVLTLTLNQALGIDLASGKLKTAYALGAGLEGKVPIISVGVAAAFLILGLEAEFSLAIASGSVKDEKLTLIAFAGLGVEGKIGPFKAYAFLGVGFAMAIVFTPPPAKGKYGGIVLMEAGIDLTIVAIKVRAELRGLVYKDASVTKCDFTGSVKVQVDLFLILSISATYQITDTATFS